MKYLIVILSLILFLSFYETISPAKVPEEYKVVVKKVNVDKRQPTALQLSIINRKAKQYNVSTTTITDVIACESSFNETALGDGGYSLGLVQIHAKYHPQVTYEQATDPEFAIDFLAEKLSKNQGYLWTCYRNLFASR